MYDKDSYFSYLAAYTGRHGFCGRIEHAVSGDGKSALMVRRMGLDGRDGAVVTYGGSRGAVPDRWNALRARRGLVERTEG